ncbi:ABC transporter ATPase [Robertkochia marina]|uniref:ABC transporter ATPase n=1 Tax=Robertkochia marina TaxID=1227945 RepID=A0A4S3LYT0_9FLAO|nr:ABC transporter ATPase [Robertkochia marina]THD66759.1 ABC transporter ATPase [Robertkochia marina]TRZ42351.1 ABC transporter ATPase [Robertkochia marina]
MLVPFESLPEDARVWIYQANRTFTEEEVQKLNEQLATFLKQWTAHGADLKAGFEIRYKRFIVIALDQAVNAATGCSIDASVHFIQQLEKMYEVDLLDKMNVSYRSGDYIAYKPLADFKKMAKDRAVSQNTIVFNNLVNNKEEYLNYWEVPARDSWHARFMN